jgi:hypothetical protein
MVSAWRVLIRTRNHLHCSTLAQNVNHVEQRNPKRISNTMLLRGADK